MKAKELNHVNFVVKHLLTITVYEPIYDLFTKVRKIMFVIPVEHHFIPRHIFKITSNVYMNAREIILVIFVVNYLRIRDRLNIISKVFMKELNTSVIYVEMNSAKNLVFSHTKSLFIK